ncbi:MULTISPECIES: RNA polymerase sigma factor FliA [Photobacterium]|uniref:RNA polymerase sigma factor FliA n=1 Tax=Photobacterium angustum TaxID=661 RepID=A0A2T3M2J2_PHOAN|nr:MULTISPECIES: RNA polymerase sigma factor FliA [Photobacterium]KJF82849.1 RNA polymerase sigma 70 [Photobacterium damselae subsp. damselae]KJF96493.1 RNA polymerase sigma 70 [Photobacterium angustum]KJG03714.1 RNA polymerase sigma 70 [Photobacterium angustum]KJG07453.1 RNA polymerase sigma 70 [Photobacterium angustum]KJG25845.1 RNA polymerase sigma 70 [Photobacterium angustum]
MNKAMAYGQYQQSPQAFIERYSSLVKRIAHHLMVRLPPSVLVEDLIQAGMIGLLEAQQNYDPTKGASFETFAGIRIRGAMLDDIRRGDWVPRSVYKNSRKISEAISHLENELGRDPNDQEIAQYLDMPLEQYHQALNDVNCGRLVGISDLGVAEDTVANEESIGENTPFQGVVDDNFRASLAEAIKTLPEREALVLSLYYDEELNLKEIGAVIGVSESRICQIHSQAMQRLRAKLTAWTA